GPAFDHSGDRESSGLAALVGTVELRAVQERAAVIADDRVRGRRLGARALLENLVLQPAGQRDDAILCLVGFKEFKTLLLVGFAELLSQFLLPLAHVALQLGKDGLRLVFG